MMRQTLWTLILLLLEITLVMAEDSCSDKKITGIVLITMACTIVGIAVIAGIIYLIWRKKNKQKPGTPSRSGNHAAGNDTYENPTFQGDIESGQAEREKEVSFNNLGFGGYVECKEYRRSPPTCSRL